jgi:hypothetical protein
MSNDVIDDTENDIYLSDHSLSMRKACDYCTELFQRLEATHGIASVNTNRDNLGSILRQHECRGVDIDVDALRRASEQHQNRRKRAHRNFWKGSAIHGDDCSTSDSAPSIAFPSSTQTINPIQIEIMQARMVRNNTGNNDDTVESICQEQVRYFKDRFQKLNVPCLITGLDQSPNFRFVNQQWRRRIDIPKDSSNLCADTIPPKKAISKVNRRWFRDELGIDCLVPLRYSSCSAADKGDSGSQSLLDEDGRAMECETKEVCMKEWIHMLEAAQRQEQQVGDETNKNTRCSNKGGQDDRVYEKKPDTIYYLKDWHLQQRYSSSIQGHPEKDALPRSNAYSSCLLYALPEFFGHDLLNSFLRKFTSGDYRFCYWGPSRSFTARHSDVLHSFSWSYNVVGTKEWTFYHSDDHPDGDSDGNCHSNINTNIDDEETNNDSCDSNDRKTFTIIQETGQTIFVPATWQHKVVNLEETISINHNWITSSNLDLVWDCLKIEMVAIQNELQGWGDGDGLDQNTEACENMLRGCIGLDVTSFCLMALVGLLEATTELVSVTSQSPNAEPVSSSNNNSSSRAGGVVLDDLVFDILRLASVLRDVITTEETIVRFQARLSAVLQSEAMAQNVESIVTKLIDWAQIN